MPNMDPRAMKNMLSKMGIKTTEIDALRVVIECADKNIVVESPQVTEIAAQGSISYQIAGSVKEEPKDMDVDITDDDIDTVMQQTGVTDREKAREALEKSNGDIAAAIMLLKG